VAALFALAADSVAAWREVAALLTGRPVFGLMAAPVAASNSIRCRPDGLDDDGGFLEGVLPIGPYLNVM